MRINPRLKNDHTNKPFICPIKDCVVKFTALNSVKRHFTRFHSHLGDWESVTKKMTFHVSTFNDSGEVEQQEQAQFTFPMVRNYIYSKNEDESQEIVNSNQFKTTNRNEERKVHWDSSQTFSNQGNLQGTDENYKEPMPSFQPPLLPNISHLLDSISQQKVSPRFSSYLLNNTSSQNLPYLLPNLNC